MEARARAGIELHGGTLRYAEVEGYGPRRLLRLGSCDFDFDVTRALWEAKGAPSSDAPITDRRVATLGEALADVYENIAAEELCVALHPPRGHSFFAPAPAEATEADRRERFCREARLLTRAEAPAAAPAMQQREAAAAAGEAVAGGGAAGIRAEKNENPGENGNALHLDARPLRTEEDAARRWFHVLALQKAVHTRLQRVTERLPTLTVRWSTSAEGAARAAVALQARRDERPPEEAPFTLVVGGYPEHLELALARDGELFHAVHAPAAAPADAAYFTAALLERLQVAPAAVGRVFAYGAGMEAPAEALAPLGRLTTGSPPALLDVCPVVGLDPGRLSKDFEPGLYVPCVGAAL